jgi:crotonobetainyl-CoA:carnitine CoA-transferase CaiB-like acyl-CoA transferase
LALYDQRVLDLSTRLSGAFCARLFADFGATVTLAEPPEGHALRHEPPFLDDQPGPERSLLHFYVNAGKRTVALAPDDHDGLEELLGAADVVVTTEHTHRDIAVGRPELLHVSITPYGLDGPLAGMPGNDLTAYARSGWAFLNGDPDQPPLKGSHNQAGYLGGLTAFVAAVAAVCERDRSGHGQLIDVSELEALTVPAAVPTCSSPPTWVAGLPATSRTWCAAPCRSKTATSRSPSAAPSSGAMR